MSQIVIDTANYNAEAGEHLIDVINRIGIELPQVCYHPQLGPIQSCDTCLVEVSGPGLFALLKRFSNKDSRRAMSAAAELLESVGRGLGSAPKKLKPLPAQKA
jgi:predicted molibdopterin-dependent oxidoreductase YjgC